MEEDNLTSGPVQWTESLRMVAAIQAHRLHEIMRSEPRAHPGQPQFLHRMWGYPGYQEPRARQAQPDVRTRHTLLGAVIASPPGSWDAQDWCRVKDPQGAGSTVGFVVFLCATHTLSQPSYQGCEKTLETYHRGRLTAVKGRSPRLGGAGGGMS